MIGRISERFDEYWGFIKYLWFRFNADGVARMASALSYTSLLALVPLLAIALAMFAAFPVFRDLRERFQEMVFENFVPHVGAAVQEQVAGFVEKAGELTAAGIIGLSVTAVMLLVTIETSLNVIFRVERERSLMSRLLVYWTSLTLGPLLIGASFSLTGYFASVGKWVADEGLSPILARGVPTLLIMVAFGLLYFAVPNRRVRPLDAAIGGVVAGLVFTAVRAGFGFYVANARTYQTVYGAIAAIPIFLVWMYVSWAVILLGAELAAALPEWRSGRRAKEGAIPPRRRLEIALEVLAAVLDAAKGANGVSREILLARTAVPEHVLRSVIRQLQGTNFIARTADGRFVLARDLVSVTLYDLVQALDLGLAETGDFERMPAAWQSRVQAMIEAADRSEREILALPLRELLGETETRRRAAS
ncbi:MAG: YihY family inner membrane protein [Rhodospirillales bacterium]|nr:YihY family inner membrane protein [Rhodospirillales bacterium]